MLFGRQKIGLDAKRRIFYSRRLKDLSTWMGPHRGFRDGDVPADREAYDRRQGSWRRASDILESARPGGLGAAVTGGASNRSRKCVVSFAPLGHSFSGGLFFAHLRPPREDRHSCLSHLSHCHPACDCIPITLQNVSGTLRVPSAKEMGTRTVPATLLMVVESWLAPINRHRCGPW